MGVKSKLVPGILVGGLVIAGGGSVLAAAGGSSSGHSAAKDQYCPPNSPQGGQPQGGPGNNCGHGTPGGPPEKPPKPKFKIRHHPRHGCASKKYAASIYVSNLQSGRKVRVYRDGHRIKNTSRHSFRVTLSMARLKSGRHTLTVMAQDANGQWTKKKVHFQRC